MIIALGIFKKKVSPKRKINLTITLKKQRVAQKENDVLENNENLQRQHRPPSQQSRSTLFDRENLNANKAYCVDQTRKC